MMSSHRCAFLLAFASLASQAAAVNIAPFGTPFVGVGDDLIGTNDTDRVNAGVVGEITDGVVLPPNVAVNTGADTNGVDTWAGAAPTLTGEFDYVGVSFGTPVNDVTQVTIQHYIANDGGWWGPVDFAEASTPLSDFDITVPILQVTNDGVSWTEVPTTNDYVSQLVGTERGTGVPNFGVAPVVTFDFAEQDNLLGIRLIENAAGNAGADANGFIAVTEFTVEGATGLTADLSVSTGELVLNSTTGIPGNIVGYEITSGSGALNASGWTSIADNYDAGSPGPDQVDSDQEWLAFPTSPDSLAEAALVAPIGDGAQFGAGLSLSLGTVWTPNPFGEDLQIELLFDDQSRAQVGVSYDGSGENPLAVGDLDFNGTIDLNDWLIVRDNYRADVTGLTAAQSYAFADLNSDGVVDILDLGLFKDAFIAENGAAAFAEMVQGFNVPEPSGLLAVAAGLFALSGTRRRGRRKVGVTVLKEQQKKAIGKAILPCIAILAALPAATTQAANIAPDGVAILGIADDIAGTNPVDIANQGVPTELNDGISFTPDELFTINSGEAPNGNGADTWAGASPDVAKEFDFVGVTWGIPAVGVNQVRLQHYLANDGGWWGPTDTVENSVPLASNEITAPTLQVTFDGVSWSDVPTTNDYVSTLTGSIRGDGFPNSIATDFVTFDFEEQDGITGIRLIGNGAGNAGGDANGFITATEIEVEGMLASLTLEVHRDSGFALIKEGPVPFDIDFYNITSTTGALDTGFTGISGGGQLPASVDGDGAGWDRLGGLDETELAEFFLTGSSVIDSSVAPIALGTVYNGDSFADEEGVAFTYRTTSGELFDGVVEFVDPTGLPGDFNDDGSVDAADYTVWRDNVGADSSVLNDNGVGAATVGQADYLLWVANFGNTAGSAIATPEPSSALLFAIGATAALSSRRKRRRLGQPVLKRMNKVASSIAPLGIALMATTALADVTVDRDYRFGDDSLEGGNVGSNVGSSNNAPATNGFTLDTSGPGGAFIDLEVNGNPVYADASSRPGASAGEQGITFDGSDSLSSALSLNSPNGFWNSEDFFPPGSNPYPFNYAGIFGRGIQVWAQPDVPALSSGTRQDLVIDTPEHGVFITAEGNWGLQYDAASIDTGVAVADSLDGSGWAHVMQVGGIADPVGGASAFGGALYVNGVAVAAQASFYDGNTSPISVGANQAGDGNFYTGTLDDLQLFVWGDNTGQDNGGAGPDGTDYGSLVLSEDNAWIANQLATLGVSDDADVNLDGVVDATDVDAFAPNWRAQNLVNGVQIGDWNTRQQGDLNYDGVIDLDDVGILYSGLLAAGVSTGFSFSFLNAVPEPSSFIVTTLLIAGCSVRRRFL